MKEKILVVDDEPDIVSVIENFLIYKGYDVSTATSALQAKKILQEMKNISVVLTDIRMPYESGIQLLKYIKANYPEIEVIMISALKDINAAIDAMKYGAFSYIVKPFQLEEVLINVRNAAERRRLILENKEYQKNLERLVEKRTNELRTALMALRKTYMDTLKALVTALEVRDVETEGHSERVVSYALRIARQMKITDTKFLWILERGALLHDIGKIGIPDAILRKKTKLTEEERKKIQSHVIIGYKILNSVEFLRDASKLVLYHHERWDGKGYPEGLKGEEIPLEARIFAVADAFDVMTSNRPYKKAVSIEEARDEIRREAGRQFDPEVVKAFLSIPLSEWEELRRQVESKKRPALMFED